MNSHAGHKWGPPIVTTATSPCYPCRTPLRIGYPEPAVKIIKQPTTVVKRRPTPGVIGNPRVSVFRIDPIPVGSIGNKATVYSRDPDITMIAIVHPCSVGLKFIIKNLQRNPGLCFRRGDAQSSHHHES